MLVKPRSEIYQVICTYDLAIYLRKTGAYIQGFTTAREGGMILSLYVHLSLLVHLMIVEKISKVVKKGSSDTRCCVSEILLLTM
jgi:hypothetical protein